MAFSPEVHFAASQILGCFFVVAVGLLCSPLFPHPIYFSLSFSELAEKIVTH